MSLSDRDLVQLEKEMVVVTRRCVHMRTELAIASAELRTLQDRWQEHQVAIHDEEHEEWLQPEQSRRLTRKRKLPKRLPIDNGAAAAAAATPATTKHRKPLLEDTAK